VCGNPGLWPYLSLGSQPLANNYHKTGEEQETFPLGVQVCPTCWHSQLTAKVHPTKMFDEYLYVSGTSQTLTNYFERFATAMLEMWQLKRPPRVLEIACNDGTLMQMLKDRGCEVMGYDPAKNLIEMCREKGLNAHCGYWDFDWAKALKPFADFDIVIAINVLPHVPDPKDFMAACREVLAPGGRVFVQTSQCSMFQNYEFDAIYHEHHSYFTIHSLTTLMNSVGLWIRSARVVPIHSASFLLELDENAGLGNDETVYQLHDDEAGAGAHNLLSYRYFAKNAQKVKTQLIDLFDRYQQAGRKVVGYGASAKFNTVANFAGLDLAYIVDDNRLKWGLETPGRDIPILHPEILAVERQPLAIVLTAWNFKDEILQKIKSFRSARGDEFVTYNGEVRRMTDHAGMLFTMGLNAPVLGAV
jgi:SAM-dependent methyltransferase